MDSNGMRKMRELNPQIPFQGTDYFRSSSGEPVSGYLPG